MSYDTWKASSPEDTEHPPPPCCVCTGDPHAPPCGEDCAHLIERCARERQIKGIYLAARRALAFAKAYRFVSDLEDPRVKRILQQVYFYRVDIARLRAANKECA